MTAVATKGDRQTTSVLTAAVRAFLALLWRDVFVDGRQWAAFAAQVILQPLFLLFVFGKVLGDLGYTDAGYGRLLMPGIVTLTAFMTALQSTAFPLVIDFSWAREIEDRLLAPLPMSAVATEKVLFSTLRSLVAAATIFPVGWLMLGFVPWTVEGTILVAVMLVLSAVTGSVVGLTLGTLVPPAKINVIFGLVMVPLMFTGSTQYPWPELSRLPWFQVVAAGNPLTYASEGMRAALSPDVPHIPVWVSVLALVGFIALFTVTGVLGFRRRALD
ncbi:ABC transporter permease [Fodinicola acaciae]|uniref:ABC transporter permease n=1 Tax=Fodinicola acaciae TaxID=2681555 RepID=UPI0013D58DCF|nr:ABC transporter permease [Fodinicola acaciae]